MGGRGGTAGDDGDVSETSSGRTSVSDLLSWRSCAIAVIIVTCGRGIRTSAAGREASTSGLLRRGRAATVVFFRRIWASVIVLPVVGMT